MKANGKMTLKKVREKKYGKMVQSMKAPTEMVVRTDTECIHGLTGAVLREIGLTTLYVDMVTINGKMDVVMRVTS